MKNIIILIIACLLLLATLPAFGRGNHHDYDIGDCSYIHDNHSFNVDFDDGTLVIYGEGRRGRGDEVEITREYELYINGDHIKTDQAQRALLKSYYHQMEDLIDRAKDIGLEGGKIGIAGAKIGLKAVSGVFKMLLTDYTEEEFEDDIEMESEELEEWAEELEEEAEELEEVAEELDEMQEELAEEIPELDDLGWFDD